MNRIEPLRLLRVLMLTAYLLISLSGCGPSSTYDKKDLAPVRRIALITVSGGLRDYEKPIECRPLVEEYSRAVDEKCQSSKDFAYVPLSIVLASKAYLDAADLSAELPSVTGPIGLKVMRLDGATRKSLCQDLSVEGLLVAMIEYSIRNDKGKIELWAYPEARLYTREREKPVWTWTGTGTSKDIDIPFGMSAKLGAKWVVFSKVSEEDVATIMKLAKDGDVGLASSSADQILQELSRVVRVAQGKESLSFNEVATSGAWGHFFEWDAAWRALLLCIGCLVLMLVFYALFSKTRSAGAISTLFCWVGTLYYAYQFLKALL